MRIFTLFDSTFCQGLESRGLTLANYLYALQPVLEVSVNSEPDEIIPLTSLRALESISLSPEGDQLLFFTASLTEKDICFLLRLLRFSAIPLIVNTAHWEDAGLARLLECGRVTFVPGELDHLRILSIIQLSRLRFSLATMQVNKVLALESSLEAQKLLAKAKAELQRHGLSESEAHKTLQRQAMEKGISIEKLVYQLS
ncbi:Response regulator with putative antiterminator output domain-like protein [Shewanella sediminis HAW-EB3]|uniref:Response regulator with putative antiterminator output domain-like protein n=1 Tax=Shewanella sediminis (strain HAW-EB3) TaxID=425104 RepID=A8FX00_SHESH|nr:ANTAR domain-containing protein [Shewanella sediminis]ABV37373.1 Response regulator with putative antiterminator output domain-like protein [Shewanella sediminis HAW-EB3]